MSGRASAASAVISGAWRTPTNCVRPVKPQAGAGAVSANIVRRWRPCSASSTAAEPVIKRSWWPGATARRCNPHRTMCRSPKRPDACIIRTQWYACLPRQGDCAAGDAVPPGRYGSIPRVSAELPATTTPHVFRHTLATGLKELGVSEEIRADILGHGTKSITQHYSHTSLRPMRQALTAWEQYLFGKSTAQEATP